MPAWTKTLVLLLLPTLLLAAARREETLFLFENRKVLIAVPDGLQVSPIRTEDGLASVRLADAKDRVSGELTFLPDPEGRFATPRARRELMHEMFAGYVESSAEKAMQFEELEPRSGAGTYCVFTDAKLVGQSTLPPGEYLHVTTGLKAWPGVVVTFRIFSQDTTSPEYQSVLRLLRESVEERAVPLK